MNTLWGMSQETLALKSIENTYAEYCILLSRIHEISMQSFASYVLYGDNSLLDIQDELYQLSLLITRCLKDMWIVPYGWKARWMICALCFSAFWQATGVLISPDFWKHKLV